MDFLAAPDGRKRLPVSPSPEGFLLHRIQRFVAVHRPFLIVPPGLPRLDSTGGRATTIRGPMRFCLLGFPQERRAGGEGEGG